MLKSSLHSLLAREMSWERVREGQRNVGGDEALWKVLGAAGWLSLPFPESLGGSGADLSDIAVAIEEVSKSAAVVPFMETMASIYAIVDTGTPGACEALAAEVHAAGGAVTPALESGGPGPIFEAGVVNGSTRYVDYGQACSLHLVSATEAEDRGLYLVDVRVPAVSQQALSNLGRTPQSSVTYRDAPAIFAGDPACVARLVEVATVLSCVQLVAYAQVALDLAVGYVKERVQFGHPLGTLQAVQHHCADMATALEATRFLTYETVWKVQRSVASPTDLAVAKAAASRTAVFVTMQSHQLHGGMGMTEEYPLQFFSRRAKERSLAWGSEHEAMLAIAQSVEVDGDWR
jgi:alkylation response protein AidB-like acyl-CoA dehydrogenase